MGEMLHSGFAIRRGVFLLSLVLMVISCSQAQPTILPSPTPTISVSQSVEISEDQGSEYYPVRYYHGRYNISVEPPLGWEVEEMDGPAILATIIDSATGTTITLSQMGTSGVQPAEEANETFLLGWLGKSGLELLSNEAYSTEDVASGWRRTGRVVHSGETESQTERWVLISILKDDLAYHLTLLASESIYDEVSDTFEIVASSLQIDPTEPIEVRREAALYLSSGEPTTLDPALTHYGADGIIGDLYSGLVSLDPHLGVRASLAERWEVTEGGTCYTFHLHRQARFHNGRPVTADDVLFSWERAAHPEISSETVMLYMKDIVGLEEYHDGRSESIAGVEVLDEHTLRVRIEAAVPYFLAKLTYPVAWVVDRYNVSLPNWELHPNGTGPFRHLQHLEEEIFILERNPWYYGEPPRLEYVVYLMYAGYTQRLYENGEVDLTGVTRDQLDRVVDPEDGLFGTVFIETGLCTYYVTFNTALAPFDDPNVRRAFVHAVDRERYVEAITNDEAVVGRGVLPPGMPGYSDEVVPPDYDPDLAKELLAGSSYYDGSQESPAIVWTLPTSGGRYSAAAAFLVDTWEDILGVNITVEGIDWDSYHDLIDAGIYGQLLKEGWCADYPDPENFLDVLFHSDSAQNHAYYSNPDYDALVERSRVEPDIERRLALYREAEQLLLDEAPALFLHHSRPQYGVWKPYVKGYVASPIGVPQHAAMWIER